MTTFVSAYVQPDNLAFTLASLTFYFSLRLRSNPRSFGTVVLHISPEAAVGGPLAALRTGDLVRLDVPERRLDLMVADDELQQRLRSWRPAPRRFRRGYYTMFLEHVLQAHEGCDFDFLRGQPGEAPYEPQIGRS